jgi:hypothetical protein
MPGPSSFQHERDVSSDVLSPRANVSDDLRGRMEDKVRRCLQHEPFEDLGATP